MAWLIIKSCNEKWLNVGKECLTYGNLIIVEQFSKRFFYDKVLFIDNSQVFLIDGVILNKRELLHEQNLETLEEWLLQRKGCSDANAICTYLRGPFTGCCYDNTNDKLYAFGNQTGDAAVFYYKDGDSFIVSSDFNMVFNICRENGIKLTFDEVAANHIMSLGYIVEGHTIAKEIRRVKPGEMVYYDNDIVREIVYHRFDNTNILDVSLEEAVDLIDIGFRKSIERCYEKDLEYGYEYHLTDLSGGLDSRMNSWVAQDLGYNQITNICYAKANSVDEKCSALVAKVLAHEFMFKQLDDLKFMYDVDEMIKKNYGLSTYNGITGGDRLLKSLNFNLFGLEHTGQLGDVIVGSFCYSADTNKIKDICDSDIIKPNVYEVDLYQNLEIYAMYYRGFQGALTSHFIRRNYTEAVSPFIDVDFMEICFSIPLKYRCGHKLYWKWIQSKYPKAAEIPSTRIRPQRDIYNWRHISRKLIGNNKRAILKLLSAVGLIRFFYPSDSMNPFDYWYHTKPDLREYIRAYFEDNIDLLNEFPETKKALELLFKGERVIDKSAAITVLGSYKVYFLLK